MPNSPRLPESGLVVYGLGGAFHWFHEIFMHRLGYRPDYLIDRNAREGEHCEGIPINNDLSAQIDAACRNRYTVVVCTGNKKTFEQIHIQLTGEGFENIVWIHELYEIHDPFGLSQETFTNANAGQALQIAAARAVFRDDLSQEIFENFIETHRTKIPRSIPQSPPETQYLPLDIDEEISLERIVMCGGDQETLIQLSRKIKSPLDAIAIFEPDPRGFQKFSDMQNIRNWVGDIENLTKLLVVSPCAISAETGIASFTSALTTFGSRLHPEGTSAVLRTTLDQTIHGIKPTYICADIEGEEINMIHGAKKTIKSFRPSLAISVYHEASHIWKIPNLIQKINPEYRFYLRNYTGFCAETILYAICNKANRPAPQ